MNETVTYGGVTILSKDGGEWWAYNGIGWERCDGPDDARLEGYCGA